MGFLVLRKLALDAFLDIFYTPIWWYSAGLRDVAHFWIYLVRRGNTALGVFLWLKNLFIPMFGQRDWQGRMVSFIVRLVQVIARAIAYGAWLILITALFALWVLAPLLLFLGIVFSVVGGV